MCECATNSGLLQQQVMENFVESYIKKKKKIHHFCPKSYYIIILLLKYYFKCLRVGVDPFLWLNLRGCSSGRNSIMLFPFPM